LRHLIKKQLITHNDPKGKYIQLCSNSAMPCPCSPFMLSLTGSWPPKLHSKSACALPDRNPLARGRGLDDVRGTTGQVTNKHPVDTTWFVEDCHDSWTGNLYKNQPSFWGFDVLLSLGWLGFIWVPNKFYGIVPKWPCWVQIGLRFGRYNNTQYSLIIKHGNG